MARVSSHEESRSEPTNGLSQDRTSVPTVASGRVVEYLWIGNKPNRGRPKSMSRSRRLTDQIARRARSRATLGCGSATHHLPPGHRRHPQGSEERRMSRAIIVGKDTPDRLFRNRREAGQVLAGLLQAYRDQPDVVVLGLARGGVPVAWEVAAALHAPLDAFIVRKLGVPGHEEFAAGALASGGRVVLNDDVVRGLRITPQQLRDVAEREGRELDQPGSGLSRRAPTDRRHGEDRDPRRRRISHRCQHVRRGASPAGSRTRRTS